MDVLFLNNTFPYSIDTKMTNSDFKRFVPHILSRVRLKLFMLFAILPSVDALPSGSPKCLMATTMMDKTNSDLGYLLTATAVTGGYELQIASNSRTTYSGIVLYVADGDVKKRVGTITYPAGHRVIEDTVCTADGVSGPAATITHSSSTAKPFGKFVWKGLATNDTVAHAYVAVGTDWQQVSVKIAPAPPQDKPNSAFTASIVLAFINLLVV
jgi:hypothetical protein